MLAKETKHLAPELGRCCWAKRPESLFRAELRQSRNQWPEWDVDMIMKKLREEGGHTDQEMRKNINQIWRRVEYASSKDKKLEFSRHEH